MSNVNYSNIIMIYLSDYFLILVLHSPDRLLTPPPHHLLLINVITINFTRQ